MFRGNVEPYFQSSQKYLLAKSNRILEDARPIEARQAIHFYPAIRDNGPSAHRWSAGFSTTPMRTKPLLNNGFLIPRIAAALVLISMAGFLAFYSFAAKPPSGTL